MIPKTLKDMNMFLAGKGYQGRVKSVTPPTLSLNTAEYRAGGMDAPEELDMGMEVLEASFTLPDADADVKARFGVQGTVIQFRGSFEDGDGNTSSAVLDMVGRIKENDAGDWSPGEESEDSCTVSLIYYKETIDGRVTRDIDVRLGKRIINGVDQLAARRQALGLQ